MRSTVFLSRAGTGLLLAGLVATSGCSWFHKTNDLYAQAPEVRPLEVPPDLDQPSVANAVNIPVPAASSGAQASAVGFTTTGSPIVWAALHASSAFSTVCPSGTGTPQDARRLLVRSLSREMLSAMALVRSVSAVHTLRCLDAYPS